MVFSAQYMRDYHQRIVNAVAEKERRRALCAAEHEITDVVGEIGLRPAHKVVELHDRAVFHAKAQRRRYTFILPLLPFLRALTGARPRVTRRPPRRELCLARQLEFAL